MPSQSNFTITHSQLDGAETKNLFLPPPMTKERKRRVDADWQAMQKDRFYLKIKNKGGWREDMYDDDEGGSIDASGNRVE